MRIVLEPMVWTPVNQGSESDFVVQNLGRSSIYMIAQTAQPTPTQPYDLIIEPLCGITSAHTNKTLWARPKSKTQITVGVI